MQMGKESVAGFGLRGYQAAAQRLAGFQTVC